MPPAGALTQRERVHVEAELPHLPFPGRAWSTKARWDYTRNATSGSTSGSIDQERPNEHTLVGKRVFSDRAVYRGGDRVRVCAELWTHAQDKTEEMQARASAMDELIASGTLEDYTAGGDTQLDRELAQLTSQSKVDDELAKMKAELGTGSGSEQKEISP